MYVNERHNLCMYRSIYTFGCHSFTWKRSNLYRKILCVILYPKRSQCISLLCRCSRWGGLHYGWYTQKLTVAGRASRWPPGTAAPHPLEWGPWRSTSKDTCIHAAHRATPWQEAGGDWALESETRSSKCILVLLKELRSLLPLQPPTQFTKSLCSVATSFGHIALQYRQKVEVAIARISYRPCN